MFIFILFISMCFYTLNIHNIGVLSGILINYNVFSQIKQILFFGY